ncbi:hypothetical protein [Ekhidna sp.]|uniref:hypothetical protein n=1 Tax=Ekhidna sp. TaxID=2608089 RepID=UPI00329857A3
MAKIKKFGTFGGVFIPSILTILGVILYMRLPMIVGEAGLWLTLGIIIVAHIISITTGLSISSMATDKKVEAGGPYYIISRSLGLPIGGTLGLALFVGLSFSISLYLIGFSESFLPFMGYEASIKNIRFVGSAALLILTTITFISTSLAIKAQFFILGAIALSIISIFFGNHDFVPEAPLLASSSSAVSLMVLFGIFFPAVTGFSAGVSMSGDLENPKKSIPKGTIAAIAVGFIIYVVLAIFFAVSIERNALITDPQILLNVSWIPELVLAGIWGATLSSALGSILGAPRILQAISVDKISPRIFAKGYGATNEPRNAVVLAFVIAEAGILIGELDVIARIVSIFFITTYGFLNISAAFEKWTSTEYRPDFKVSGWVSLIGAVACLIVMIQLDFVAMLGATLILGVIYFYLKRKELTLDSGDAWSGVWASLVKTGLTNLMREKLQKRNWRPNVIMFSGNPANRTHMINMGKAIVGKLGLLSAFELVVSDDKIMTKSQSDLEKGKDEIGFFKQKLHTRDIYSGMDQIARVYGFSGVEPNTILMGWSKNPTNKERFIDLLESFGQEKFNTLFLNYDHDRAYGNFQSIDIWWSGSGRNLAFAINLIRHITNAPDWNRANVRVLIINPIEAETENIYKKTFAILERYRLDADIKIINNEVDKKSDKEIIEIESSLSDLTVLGVPANRFRDFGKYFDEINDTVSSVGSSLVINASVDFEDLEVVTKVKAKQEEESEISILAIPELDASQYEEITIDLQKIDQNGRRVIDQLFEKSFHPIFLHHQELLSELKDRGAVIQKELDKIREIPELFKRKKAVDKLKNESLFKLNAFISGELIESELIAQKEKLQLGIDWYSQQLLADFHRFPKKMKVRYVDQAFEIKKNDTFKTKVLKRWKRIKHSIVGKPITQKIKYREIARFYQLNSRMVFADRIFKKLLDDEHTFYKRLRQTTSSIISALNDIERKIWTEEKKWNEEKLEAIVADILLQKEGDAKLETLYHSRFLVEFRNNLTQMRRDMEKVEINQLIKKRNSTKKLFAQAESELQDFAENFSHDVKTLINMISLELSVNSTKNRQETLLVDLWNHLGQSISINYLKKVEGLISKLEKGEEVDLKKVKFELDFETETKEIFEQHQAKMLLLTDELPDNIEIYSILDLTTMSESDPIDIPVSRMAEYYLKSRYESPIEELFEGLLETIKRGIFSSQEAINLAQFYLENKESNELTEDEVLVMCKSKLEKERSEIEGLIAEFKEASEKLLEKAYEPLETVRIQESAEDFTVGLRSYQSKQVLSGAGAILDTISRFVQNILIRLLYTKSETILFAEKMDHESQANSINSRLLDLKETLSPTKRGIQYLPQYYVTLFNGKSNINKDFWVKRPKEESAFKKAVTRHRAGYHGGILLLGDRNSGKTTFCRYLAQNIFKSSTVYTMFPPIPGTHTVEGFNQSMSKATQKRGEAEQMLSRLPENSVLIINDLELFWERSEQGLAVIHKLEFLMDKYGSKILFIVNMNPQAFKLINQLTSLEEHFIEVISMESFDAEDLNQLIMQRHKSSGLSFGYNEKHGQISELKKASLFNDYFNYSKGSPGVTLNGWLSNITASSKDFVVVNKPVRPALDVFDELDEDWIMLLLQFILHKRLTEDKIIRITDWSKEQTSEKIHALLRSGVIVEKSSGIYNLDPILHPFILDALKERKVL